MITPASPALAPTSRLALLGSLCLLAAGCSGSSGSSGSTTGTVGARPPSTTSLGLSARSVVGAGELIAFSVLESEEGNRDLNGDGDQNDAVLFAHDASTNTTTNLGFAVNEFVVQGSFVAFAASEQEQSRDLNADGDTSDLILHTYDSRNGTISNESLELGRLRLDGSIQSSRTFATQGSLLVVHAGSGNGQALTLRVFDLELGTRLDTGFQRPSFGFGPQNRILAIEGESLAGKDLNGDGDMDDRVIQVLDLITGQITNVGHALRLPGPLSPITVFSSSDELLFMAVDEASDGVADYDGDGLSGSRVLHTFDFSSGRITNTKIALSDSSRIQTTGQHALIRNQNSDLLVWDASSSTTWNTGLCCQNAVVFNSGALLSASEALNGIDFNLDGDTDDNILQHLDFVRSSTFNLNIEAFPSLDLESEIIVTSAESESGQDLNGDGDTLDLINFIWLKSATRLLQIPLEGNPLAVLDGSTLLTAVNRPDQDLNGDGDMGDDVAFLGDLRNLNLDAIYNLGQALSPTPQRGFVYEQVLPLLVSEAAQGGSDLNGDGDNTDDVLFLIRR